MPEAPPRPLTPALTLLLAAATGVAVANIYYAQPMLGLIAGGFGASGAAAATVATVTQLGYALGLVLLVPLGDAVDRRRLILWQSAGLVAALAAAAAAPSLSALVAASAAIGVASTIAQQIVPFVAELAGPERRGRAVGLVMSGLLTGILLARTLSGAVGSWAGWRVMFLVGAVIAALMGAVLGRALPSSRPRTRVRYGALLLSLASLVRDHPPLLRAGLIQGALFAGFSAFWSTLALRLEGPPFHRGAAVAGLFGVVGLAGVLVAPLAGRVSDRRGPRPVVGAGLAVVLLAFAVLASSSAIPGMVLGVVLLDGGIQLSMIANQSIVFALSDAARSRINTVFVTVLFLGGALGSAGGSLAWHLGGWPAVSGFGAALALAAAALHLRAGARPA